MKCPRCGGVARTVDTRDAPDNAISRRRKCGQCGFRFKTTEKIRLTTAVSIQEESKPQWRRSVDGDEFESWLTALAVILPNCDVKHLNLGELRRNFEAGRTLDQALVEMSLPSPAQNGHVRPAPRPIPAPIPARPEKKSGSPSKLPDDAELIELYRAYSGPEIARKFGVSAERVYQRLRAAGHTPKNKRVAAPPKPLVYPKPIGCERCVTEPYARGLCRLCWNRAQRRGVLDQYEYMYWHTAGRKENIRTRSNRKYDLEAVYAFVLDFMAETGQSPSMTQLATAFDSPSSAIGYYLKDRLVKLEWVQWSRSGGFVDVRNQASAGLNINEVGISTKEVSHAKEVHV